MAKTAARIKIPESGDAKLVVDKREVRLTNLDKLFWPEPRHHEGDADSVLR